MRFLRWSTDINHICEVCDALTAEEALHVLKDELLGDDYYIVDPVGEEQANAIIVETILRYYSPRRKKKI